MIDLKGVDCLFIVKKDLHRSSLRLLKVLSCQRADMHCMTILLPRKLSPRCTFCKALVLSLNCVVKADQTGVCILNNKPNQQTNNRRTPVRLHISRLYAAGVYFGETRIQVYSPN